MFPRLRQRLRTSADYLSGGEQQMLAVARALSGNVRLLLLDEPFEGLAPAVVEELFTAFDRLRRDLGILIVEHNLDLVLALADRAFALERGAIFHEGPAEELLYDLDYRKEILWLCPSGGANPAGSLRTLRDVTAALEAAARRLRSTPPATARSTSPSCRPDRGSAS